MNMVKNLLTATLVMISVGCGGGFANNSDLGSTADVTALSGNWLAFGGCMITGGGSVVHSMKVVVTFAGSSIASLASYYTDSACSALYAKEQTSAIFALGDTVSVIGGNLITYAPSSATLTPMTPAAASDFNTKSVCGTGSGWSNGGPRSIMNVTCSIDTGFSEKAVSTPSYDIVKLDSTKSPATLTFGDSSTGDEQTPATRPTKYQTLLTYTKQP
jgi:hypothetical protein